MSVIQTLASISPTIKRLKEENAELRASLAWAMQNGPDFISPDYCRYCGQQSHGDKELIHGDNCQWLKAKHLLEETK